MEQGHQSGLLSCRSTGRDISSPLENKLVLELGCLKHLLASPRIAPMGATTVVLVVG
jgi:hypothetical protein